MSLKININTLTDVVGYRALLGLSSEDAEYLTNESDKLQHVLTSRRTAKLPRYPRLNIPACLELPP